MFTPQIIGKRFFRTKENTKNHHQPYLLTIVDRFDSEYYYYKEHNGCPDSLKDCISKKELFSDYNSIQPNYCINIIMSNNTIVEKADGTKEKNKSSAIFFIDQISPKTIANNNIRSTEFALTEAAYLVIDGETEEIRIRTIITDKSGSTMVVVSPVYNNKYLCIIYLEDKSTYFRRYGYINSSPMFMLSYTLAEHADTISSYIEPKKFLEECRKISHIIHKIFNIVDITDCDYTISADLKQTSSFLAHFKRFDNLLFRKLSFVGVDKIDSIEKLLCMLTKTTKPKVYVGGAYIHYDLETCFFVRYNDFVNVFELIENVISNGLDIKFLKFTNADLAMVYRLKEVFDNTSRPANPMSQWIQSPDNDGSLSYEEICTLFAHKHN